MDDPRWQKFRKEQFNNQRYKANNRQHRVNSNNNPDNNPVNNNNNRVNNNNNPDNNPVNNNNNRVNNNNNPVNNNNNRVNNNKNRVNNNNNRVNNNNNPVDNNNKYHNRNHKNLKQQNPFCRSPKAISKFSPANDFQTQLPLDILTYVSSLLRIVDFRAFSQACREFYFASRRVSTLTLRKNTIGGNGHTFFGVAISAFSNLTHLTVSTDCDDRIAKALLNLNANLKTIAVGGAGISDTWVEELALKHAMLQKVVIRIRASLTSLLPFHSLLLQCRQMRHLEVQCDIPQPILHHLKDSVGDLAVLIIKSFFPQEDIINFLAHAGANFKHVVLSRRPTLPDCCPLLEYCPTLEQLMIAHTRSLRQVQKIVCSPRVVDICHLDLDCKYELIAKIIQNAEELVVRGSGFSSAFSPILPPTLVRLSVEAALQLDSLLQVLPTACPNLYTFELEIPESRAQLYQLTVPSVRRLVIGKSYCKNLFLYFPNITKFEAVWMLTEDHLATLVRSCPRLLEVRCPDWRDYAEKYQALIFGPVTYSTSPWEYLFF